MAEIKDEKADIMIALLAQLVAAGTDGDPALALTNAGMKPSDVARLLGMKANSVAKRVSRAADKPSSPGGKNAKGK